MQKKNTYFRYVIQLYKDKFGWTFCTKTSEYVYYDSILKVHTTRMFWQIIFEYVNAKTVTD